MAMACGMDEPMLGEAMYTSAERREWTVACGLALATFVLLGILLLTAARGQQREVVQATWQSAGLPGRGLYCPRCGGPAGGQPSHPQACRDSLPADQDALARVGAVSDVVPRQLDYAADWDLTPVSTQDPHGNDGTTIMHVMLVLVVWLLSLMLLANPHRVLRRIGGTGR
jgi:hypothetical protein